MFKNCILYRRWWYVKRRNIKKIRLLLRLALAAIIMWLVLMASQSSVIALFSSYLSS
ncbi:MAG: hypothetical protein ABFD25_15450 [Clostridiaceae bacterium]